MEEFVHVDGEDEPYILYKPYVYATVIECSNHYAIFNREKQKVKIIMKKGE